MIRHPTTLLRKLWRLSKLSVIAILFHCASPGIVPKKPFVPEAYREYSGQGTSTISGTVFLSSKEHHGRIYGRLTRVCLDPATDYSNEWFHTCILGATQAGLKESDVSLAGWNQAGDFRRKSYSDKDGKFVFDNLPAGKYYITARVLWYIPIGWLGVFAWDLDSRPVVAIAYCEAAVEQGESIDVAVTRPEVFSHNAEGPQNGSCR